MLVLNRRDLLAGAGVGAALIASVAVPAQAAAMLAPVTPWRLLYDDRYPMATDYARRACPREIIRAVRGDPTDIWYNELSLEWQKRPATVQGLTRADTLFVLEGLAWTNNLRVVDRRPVADTGLILWTIAQPTARARTAPFITGEI